MIWILKNWRLVSMAIAVIGVTGVIAYIYHKGGADREDKIVSEAIIEKIKERDRLDEIRDSAVDLPVVLNRMQDRSF